MLCNVPIGVVFRFLARKGLYKRTEVNLYYCVETGMAYKVIDKCTAAVTLVNTEGTNMDLCDRITEYLQRVICADVDEVANEVPCSVDVALRTLQSNPHMFWHDKNGMWFAVGASAMEAV